MFIADTPEQEEAARSYFVEKGLRLKFCRRLLLPWGLSRSIGRFGGVGKPQVDAWSHKFKILIKMSKQHPQSAYAVLGILLQI